MRLLWTSSLLVTALSQTIVDATTTKGSHDHIIVGGGTAGLVLANRLSEDPNVSVAVIDPGPDQRNNSVIKNPQTWPSLIGAWEDWKYTSTPQAALANQSLMYSAGKGLGGSSLINGMTYIRGDKAQFDAWEKLGNPGWNWESMDKQYKNIERFFKPASWQEKVGASYESQYHGYDGHLHVGFNPLLPNGSFYDINVESWAKLGQPVNKDVNSGNVSGFGVWPQTLDPTKNVRWDAATAYLWPVVNRPNLELINGTVWRFQWKNGTSQPEAAAVEYFDPEGSRKTISVGKEVIISAGALRTPLVLENSGIGNPNILKQHSIDTVVDLPAVGEHMLDQTNFGMLYQPKKNGTGYTPYAVFVTAKDIYGDKFDEIARKAKGQLKSWAKQVADASNGGVEASAMEKIYEVQYDLIFNSGATMSEILITWVQNIIVTGYWPILPWSRGRVHLNATAGPSVSSLASHPSIDPAFFTNPLDAPTNISLGALAQAMWKTTPAARNFVVEDSPSQSNLGSNSHTVGTAAMMAKELGGVVDPRLKVYGTKNVRVVDASVLPLQFSGHLSATVYAVAERAAEFIKEDGQHGS